jgi:hypothetical protein
MFIEKEKYMLVDKGYDSNKILFNFLIPKSLKDSFEVVCKYNISNKSQILNKLIKKYVLENEVVIGDEVDKHNKMMNIFKK